MADRSFTQIGGWQGQSTRAKAKKNLQKKNVKSEGSKKGSLASTTPEETSPARIGKALVNHLRSGRHRRDIPFLLPMIQKKSQIVEIRMCTPYTNVSVTASTNFSSVATWNMTNFIDVADVKSLFDEVRPIIGKVFYMPRYVVGVNGTSPAICGAGGAVIDLANSSSFATSDSLVNHDNHVLFDLYRTNSHPTNKGRFSNATAAWTVLWDAYPDSNWADTNATPDIFFWKPWFGGGDIPLTGTAGYLVAEVVFQFRGLK